MHNYKVITLPMAEDDIQDQTDYIAFDLKSPETAINMARGFRKTINNLSIFPQSHEFDEDEELEKLGIRKTCLLYTSPSPRDRTRSRMPSSA